MKKISIMVPCYNEEENVVPLSEAPKVFDMIADPDCGTCKVVVDCTK